MFRVKELEGANGRRWLEITVGDETTVVRQFASVAEAEDFEDRLSRDIVRLRAATRRLSERHDDRGYHLETAAILDGRWEAQCAQKDEDPYARIRSKRRRRFHLVHSSGE